MDSNIIITFFNRLYIKQLSTFIIIFIARKIHVSLETKLLLETFGEFIIEHRGMVFVKGKGELDTYWLIKKNAAAK